MIPQRVNGPVLAAQEVLESEGAEYDLSTQEFRFKGWTIRSVFRPISGAQELTQICRNIKGALSLEMASSEEENEELNFVVVNGENLHLPEMVREIKMDH